MIPSATALQESEALVESVPSIDDPPASVTSVHRTVEDCASKTVTVSSALLTLCSDSEVIWSRNKAVS